MPDVENPELVLCERALAGERSAFAELVQSHQGAVRNQLRRLTHGDAALADDLAQESFIQAWTHLAQFKGQARLASWLYRIAYHRFLMHLRSHQAMVSLTDGGETEDRGEAPGHGVPARAMQLDVEAALARLPEAERVALIHCYYLDLSHEEAAQVLDLPLGTLKSQVLRGKARLREILAAWAPEGER
jgi:RNA polymerase sigma-70 factor (ECF subfamily)